MSSDKSAVHMQTYPQVGIIVLNYNGARCLPECLRSLERLDYPNKDIIVVDNHSTDASLGEAEKAFPHHTYIRNVTNEGFAKGMNIGMKVALGRGAKWCWIFNYDATADPQALKELIRVSRLQPQAGLLSPIIYCRTKREKRKFTFVSERVKTSKSKTRQLTAETDDPPAGGESVAGACSRVKTLYSPDGRIWFAKGGVNYLRMRTEHRAPNKRERGAESYPSDFLTGCALLIREELIRTIGFLDEIFFLYYEDADYSIRARRAGFLCHIVPGARVFHSEISQESPTKTYFLVYSGLLFFQKWTPFWLDPYMWVYSILRRIKNALERVLKRSPSAEEVMRAYRDYYQTKRVKRKFTFVSERSAGPLRRSYSEASKIGATPVIIDNKPFFSIIFVNYRSAHYLAQALQSLFSFEREGTLFEVIVVNNDKEESAALKELGGRLRFLLVESGANVGFASGSNRGAAKARGEILCFINPDVRWTGPYLRRMAKVFSDFQALGVLGMSLVDENGCQEIWSAGKEPSLKNLFINNIFPLRTEISPVDGLSMYDWVSGGALCIREELFSAIGGFDERFFLYFEDVDLCSEVRKRGYAVARQNAFSLIHLGGKSHQSTSLQKKYYYDSQKKYFKKWRPLWENKILSGMHRLLSNEARGTKPSFASERSADPLRRSESQPRRV